MKKKKISIEDKLIFLCARINIDSSTQKNISQLLYKPISWNRIIETSNHHKILPFLYYNLNKINLLDLIPQDTLAILKNSYYCNIDRNAKLWEEFSSILKSINDTGVKIVLLKGIILIEELYHNPGLRAMADVDILVKENEMDKIKNLLLQSEYIENSGYILTKYYKKYQTEFVFTKKVPSNAYFCLDIHTSFIPPRPYKIALPHLWERTQERTIYGQRISFLSWEDTFLSLALHLRRHTHIHHLSLGFIVDVAELLNSNKNNLDWDYIKNMALKNRIIYAIYFALYISKELLDVSISEELLNRFKPYFLKDRLIYLSVNRYNFLTTRKWQGIVLRILLFDRAIDFILCLWQVFFLERFIAKGQFKNILRH